jgi:hypothetical protein
VRSRKKSLSSFTPKARGIYTLERLPKEKRDAIIELRDRDFGVREIIRMLHVTKRQSGELIEPIPKK